LKNYLLLLLTICLLAFSSSCSTLSKEQLHSIEKFSNACDSFSRYPSLLFTEIAQIRLERGLFYAASLSDAQNRVEELNALHKAHSQDLQLANQYDASLKILKSYSSALKLLVSENRSKSRGVELRSVGRSLDTLVTHVNSLNLFKEALPVGIAKSAAIMVGYGAEKLLKRKQHRLAKSFIKEADTLVQTLVASLVESLRDQNVSTLIENEKRALPANFKSYLLSREGSHTNQSPTPLLYHKEYLELLKRSGQLTYSRGYITSAANRLAKSHKELLLSLEKGRPLDELIDNLNTLIEELEMLQKHYKTIISLI